MPTSAQILPNPSNQSAASAEPPAGAPRRKNAHGLEDAFALVLSGFAVNTDSGKAVMHSLTDEQGKAPSQSFETRSQRETSKRGRAADGESRRGERVDDRATARQAAREDARDEARSNASLDAQARSARTSRGTRGEPAAQLSTNQSSGSASSAIDLVGTSPSGTNTTSLPTAPPTGTPTNGVLASNGAHDSPSQAGEQAQANATNPGSSATLTSSQEAAQSGAQGALQLLDRSLSQVNAPRSGPTDAITNIRSTIGVSNASKAGLGGTKARASRQPAAPRPGGAEAALRAQASRGLALALRNNSGSATIRLDPQHLGTLRIEVVVQEGSVRAVFKPESAEAQRLLQHDHRALEHALGARGLRVDKIEIVQAQEGSSGRHAASDGSASNQATEGHDTRTGDGAQGSPHGDPGRQHHAHHAQGVVHNGSRSEERTTTIGSTAEHVETTPATAEPRLGNSLIDTIA